MARGIKTPVRMWNFVDEVLAQRGQIDVQDIKSVEFQDVIVDTGSTRLVLTKELVQQLGLILSAQPPLGTQMNELLRRTLPEEWCWKSWGGEGPSMQ